MSQAIDRWLPRLAQMLQAIAHTLHTPSREHYEGG